MPWTQDQLDRLDAAIAEGVVEVQYQDKKVRYHSLDEMLKLRDKIARSLGQSDACSRRTYVTTGKGS